VSPDETRLTMTMEESSELDVAEQAVFALRIRTLAIGSNFEHNQLLL
jgi:hypothetical protein